MAEPGTSAQASSDLIQAAVRLAVGGQCGATAQQHVLNEMLDAAVEVTPQAVLTALASRFAGTGDEEQADRRRAMSRLAALGATVTIAGTAGYPALLSDAWPELGAPLWLFVAGARPPLVRRPAVAVVGTRAPTADGKRTAHDLAAALADAGVLVVSGLARGIDQAAHQGALDAGGDTVAVLGTGLGVDYPARSQQLRSRIAANGALVTELPPGAPPRPWQFLERNRIISGLADATVVVEGRARSGALQTARLAGSQGRDVWAVPGSLNSPTSAAPLALMRDGALPITSIGDFVAAVATGQRCGATRVTPLIGRGADRGGQRTLALDLEGSVDDDEPDAAADGADTAHADTADADRGDGADAAHADRTRLASAGSWSPTAVAVYDLLSAVPASTDDLVVAGTLPTHQVLVAIGELVDRRVAVMTPRGVVRA